MQVRILEDAMALYSIGDVAERCGINGNPARGSVVMDC